MSAPIIREPQSVWMVWTKHGHRPKFCHANKRKAMREAARLARLKPGQKFIVMRMVAKVHVEAEGGEA